jgi:hypothetical protein
VCVLESGVPAEAAVGRNDVGGVACEEHAALAETLGTVRLRPPRGDVNDLHRQVGSDRRAQETERPLRGQARLHIDR